MVCVCVLYVVCWLCCWLLVLVVEREYLLACLPNCFPAALL